MSPVYIAPYEDKYLEEFQVLNLEWLDKYGLKEETDMIVLNDPRGEVIDKGGFIWVAIEGEKVIGTSALIREHHNIYELAKMSVNVAWRGKGISKMLIETCIGKARELGASKLELYSNSQLRAALGLYERYGFNYVEVKDSRFVTADIKMELVL